MEWSGGFGVEWSGMEGMEGMEWVSLVRFGIGWVYDGRELML